MAPVREQLDCSKYVLLLVMLKLWFCVGHSSFQCWGLSNALDTYFLMPEDVNLASRGYQAFHQ